MGTIGHCIHYRDLVVPMVPIRSYWVAQIIRTPFGTIESEGTSGHHKVPVESLLPNRVHRIIEKELISWRVDLMGIDIMAPKYYFIISLVYKHIYSTDLYRKIQTYTNIYRHVQTYTEIHKNIQTYL